MKIIEFVMMVLFYFEIQALLIYPLEELKQLSSIMLMEFWFLIFLLFNL